MPMILVHDWAGCPTCGQDNLAMVLVCDTCGAVICGWCGISFELVRGKWRCETCKPKAASNE